MNERLYRSRDDRIIAGVAGGLADRLNIDSALVRIVWAILILPTGFVALFVYVVMALVVPDEDDLYRAASHALPSPTTPWPGPGGVAPPTAPIQPPAAPAQPPPAPLQGARAPYAVSQPVAGQPARPVTAAPGTAPLTGTFPTAGPVAAPGSHITREQWRAQRRADREARRGPRRSGSAPLVTGAILILLGVWFLVREYLPAVEPGRFWPVALVGLGIVLLIAAAVRRSDGTGNSS